MSIASTEFLASAARKLAIRLQKRPFRYDVALLSRQSSVPSRDFTALNAELARRLGAERVTMLTSDSELSGKAEFATHMYRQLKVASVSRVIVLDGYNPAVSIPPKREGAKVLQIWHAPGAIKKFGYQSIGTPAGRSAEAAAAAHMHKNYDWIVAAGPGAVDAYAEAFGYPQSSVLPLGLPRIDYLIQDGASSPRIRRAVELRAEFPFLADARPKLLYAPTLRRGDGYEGWVERYLRELLEALEGQDVDLIFAGHPLDRGFSDKLLERYPKLRLCPGVETADLLEDADWVVSDYSSIALEAGLIGKRVLFYVPDLDVYRQSPGLNIDLADPATCFASKTAQGIARAVSGLPDDGGARGGARAWAHYCGRYFEGITPGSTARIADFIQTFL